VAVPFAVLGGASFVRDEMVSPASVGTWKLLNILPDWQWESFALILMIVILGIVFESSYRMVREKSAQIFEYEKAWDRTDKNLMLIREAVLHVAECLRCHSVISEGEKLKKAATKIREIGIEGQAAIWGREYLHESGMFEDHKVITGDMFWHYNLLHLGNVMQADLDLPQTTVDAKINTNAQPQLMYGHLMISKHSIAAMFPRTVQ
jgi:hypothetical protein